MAIALVTHSIGAPTTTPDVDTSGANLIVLAVASIGSNGPSDNKSNSWTFLKGTPTGTFGDRTLTYYCVNPTVGASHNFTAGANTSPVIGMLAFSGVLTTTPAGTTSSAYITAVSGNLYQPGSVTPSEDNEVLIATCGDIDAGASGTPSADSGFTVTDNMFLVGGVNFSLTMSYLVQTTATATNPLWTVQGATSGSTDVSMVLLSFKAGATTNTDTTWMGRPDRPMANFFPTIVKVP